MVANGTNTTLTMISICFSIFDEDGFKIEDASDYISTLRPGGKWKFAAFVFAEEAASAEEVIELTGATQNNKKRQGSDT